MTNDLLAPVINLPWEYFSETHKHIDYGFYIFRLLALSLVPTVYVAMWQYIITHNYKSRPRPVFIELDESPVRSDTLSLISINIFPTAHLNCFNLYNVSGMMHVYCHYYSFIDIYLKKWFSRSHFRFDIDREIFSALYFLSI